MSLYAVYFPIKFHLKSCSKQVEQVVEFLFYFILNFEWTMRNDRVLRMQ